MLIRNLRIKESKKLIGYSNNHSIKIVSSLLIGSRQGLNIIDFFLNKYTFIKLYTFLKQIYSNSPNVDFYIISESFRVKIFVNEKNLETTIYPIETWVPGELYLLHNSAYNWYKRSVPGVVYIPDIYSNFNALHEANRIGLPILSLLNLNNSVKKLNVVDYPIFCNLYSLEVVLWFSKYIIRIIQSEIAFFKEQSTYYKSRDFRDELKIQSAIKRDISKLGKIKKNKQLSTYLMHFYNNLVRSNITKERFFKKKLKKIRKNFIYSETGEPKWGKKTIPIMHKYKKWLNCKFNYHLLNKKKRYSYKNGQKSKNLKYKKYKKYKNRKISIKNVIQIFNKEYFYNSGFKKYKNYLKLRNIFHIKSKYRLQHIWIFDQLAKCGYIKRFFQKKRGRRFLQEWILYMANIKAKNTWQRLKKKNVFFFKNKKISWLYFRYLRARWGEYTHLMQEFRWNTKHKLISIGTFYRSESNAAWQKYVQHHKFQTNGNRSFWAYNAIFSWMFASVELNKLTVSLTGQYLAAPIILNNNFWSQKGFKVSVSSNIAYNTKYCMWSSHCNFFRKNVINYKSLYDRYKNWEIKPSQRERNINNRWMLFTGRSHKEFSFSAWYKIFIFKKCK